MRGTLNEDTVNDDTVRDTLTVFRRDRVDEIANLTAVFLARLGDVDRNWTTFNDEVGKVLVAFQKRVTQAIKDHGWDGRDDTDPDQWSFSASLLYAVTVITTIGKTGVLLVLHFYIFNQIALTDFEDSEIRLPVEWTDCEWNNLMNLHAS